MDQPFNMEMALPKEVAYPLPTTLPPGMRQVRLRQPQYAAIVDPLPAGSGIDLIIPEIPGAFGDPSTTSIEVTGYFETRFVVPAGRPFWMQSATCNGCVWGSGNSIFQRYQLYLLSSVLSDDITEWGLTAHLVFLASYDRQQRLALSSVMGFNLYEPSSSMGLSLAGVTKQDAAYLVAEDGVFTNIRNKGWNIYQPTVVDGQNDYFFSLDNFSSTSGSWGTKYLDDVSLYVDGTFTLRQPFQFNLQLPGIIGSGSSQLFPMFIGPYKISLFADDTSNFMWWDLAPFMNGTGREFIAPTNNFAPSDVTYTNSLHITNIFFQCDYIQCDGPSFAIVMSQLPIPDTFALRTTAWTSASTLIPVESQGTVDLAIPIRRASLKCCYTLFSPARNPVTAPAGKFEWVNPNLGANTLIHINGKPYPQMGLDPTNRPNEVFKNFLLTIGTWNNDGPKSCIRPENFFVIDQILPASNGKQIRYNRWRNYHSTSTRLATTTGYVGTQTGAHTIRPAARPGLYSDITAPDDSLRSYSDVDWLRQGGPFGGVVSSASLGLRSAFLTPSQSFDPQVSSINVHLVADNGTVAANATTIAVLNSQTNLDPATDNSSLIQFEGTRCPLQGKFSANPTMACASNQFVLAYDFEHLAKVQYLSGVQSLTGSFFLKLTIERNLSVAYNATFICAFDQLVILHSALKTAFVRI